MLISLIKSSACLLFFILLWLLPSFQERMSQYFDRIEHFITRNKKTVVFTTLGLYIAITLVLQFYHSPDGDEIQAWFIARDSGSLWKMYSLLGYEGSPGLWHTLLFPIAKSGAPFQIIYFINHFFAITAVILWLLFAPFPLFVRVLFPFIHVFLTLYSIYARSYTLCFTLLYTAMALYKTHHNRWQFWSLAFFLFANTSLTATLLTCGFTLFLFLKAVVSKNKTDWKALSVIGVGILLACLQVYPPEDLVRRLSEFRFQMAPVEITTDMITGNPVLSFLIYLALIIQVMVSFKNKFAFYGFLSVQIALFFLFLFKYRGAVHNHFFLIISILMFLWIADIKENKKRSTYIFIIAIFSLMVTTTVRVSINNIKNYADHKKAMGKFIDTKIQPDSTTFIACHPDYIAVGILPYLQIRSMYMPDDNRWGSYVIWNQQRESGIFNPGVVQNVMNLAKDHPGYKDYYYLTYYELPTDSVKHYHIDLLKKATNQYQRKIGRHSHTYHLYKLPGK
jgi:hypothetical protein